MLFGAGDVERARHHLALALRCATTPEDRADAIEKLQDLRMLLGDVVPEAELDV